MKRPPTKMNLFIDRNNCSVGKITNKMNSNQNHSCYDRADQTCKNTF